jgi:hypothetical protein
MHHLGGYPSNTCPAVAAPLQVRASLFAAVVGSLGECAALRHVAPDDPLWQQAAAGLVSVVNAGLPAVNIMFVNHHQPPENAWQVSIGYDMECLAHGVLSVMLCIEWDFL